MRVPAFMDTLINSPEVSEGRTVIGALEHKIADERRLVSEIIDEELDFIQNTDVVLFVLDLEVAV